MPAARGALGEMPAQAVVARLTGRAGRFDAPRTAREPGVEHDTLAHFERRHRRPDLHHVGHHLVTKDRREREVAVERAVAVVVPEVHEDHLGVGAANAGETRLGHRPVVAEQRRPVEFLHPHGHVRQPDEEPVAFVGRNPRLRTNAVEQALHVRSSPFSQDTAPKSAAATTPLLELLAALIAMPSAKSTTQPKPMMMPAMARPSPR